MTSNYSSLHCIFMCERGGGGYVPSECQVGGREEGR